MKSMRPQIKSQQVSPRATPSLQKSVLKPLNNNTPISHTARSKLGNIQSLNSNYIPNKTSRDSKATSTTTTTTLDLHRQQQPYQHPQAFAHNESCCYIEQSTLSTQKSRNIYLQHSHTQRGVTGKEIPNPTSFSNVRRTISPHPEKNMQNNSHRMKFSEKRKEKVAIENRQNQNLIDQNNFSATDRLEQKMSNKGIEWGKKGNQQHQQTLSVQNAYYYQGLNGKQSLTDKMTMSRGGQQTTTRGSSFNQTNDAFNNNINRMILDGFELVEVERSSESSSYSHSSAQYIEEYIESEGEVEISQLNISKQLPKVLNQFSNIFQKTKIDFSLQQKQPEQMNTLEKILEDSEKFNHQNQVTSSLNNLLSTQACTQMKPQITSINNYKNNKENRRFFDQRTFSPSRIKDSIALTQIPCKILPTLEMCDITRGDLSHTNRFSILSNPIITKNPSPNYYHQQDSCSVPEITSSSNTNSSILSSRYYNKAELKEKGQSIISQEAPLFPQQFRDPDLCHLQKLSQNSFLQNGPSSFNEEGVQSLSSMLDSSSHLTTNHSCLICPPLLKTLSNHSNTTLNSDLQSKFMLNLELLLLLESKLSSILQQLHHLFSFTQTNHHDHHPQQQPSSDKCDIYYASISQLCEEWWQVSIQANLFEIYKIYRDSSTRKVIRRALIVECITVVIVACLIGNGKVIKGEKNVKKRILEKMMREVVQNMLQIVCMVMQRMGKESCEVNVWAKELRGIVQEKVKKAKKGMDVFEMEESQRNKIISKHTCKIIKYIKSLNSFYTSQISTTYNLEFQSILFTNVSFILQEIDKSHLSLVRDILVQALNHENIYLQQLGNNGYQHDNMQLIVGDEQNRLLECQEEIEIQQEVQDQENKIQQQHLSTINEDCSYYSGLQQSPCPSPELIAPQPPYLQPLCTADKPKYTLVLDLDETLIHYIDYQNDNIEYMQYQQNMGSNNSRLNTESEQGGLFLVRPGVHNFLREMNRYYEIVIFTAAMQDYADWVLDQLDVENYISHRLYRQHAIPAGQFYIKDLSRLGRDLSRTLIVDNVAENFQLQPDNGVFIRTWIDDPADNALFELAPLLKEIVVKGVPDVREALKIFRMQMMEQVQRGIMKPHLTLDHYEFNNSNNDEQENH